jgi:hypothetical protein
MADVSGKFYSATKVRTGVSPSSPGVEVGETLPPVNPPGGGLNSVGLTMPSAFAVANSPLTSNGTLAVTGAGTVAQYVRGDGSLADFPATTGGGASVSYYLNGSVSQGTIGGVAYREFNRMPVFGAGTDITTNSDGYIASFITDAGDPNKLLIPAGNWNLETYFSASSGGGSPTFYVELYKYDGSTFTLIASSATSPELIAFGTNLNPYFSTLAVPQTTLALTDRLALRYYVNTSGRTITLHTENDHLCQVITTFTTGLTALNGLTTQVQFFAVGTSGTDFNIASATDTHTFNLPTASSTNRGALSNADWALFTQAYNDKINSASVTGTTTKTLTLTQQDGGTITASWTDLNTDAVISVFGRTGAVVAANGDYTTAQVTESGNLYFTNARSRQAISLTTSGTSGAATYDNSTGVFNIPQYQSVITNPVTGTGSAGQVAYWLSSSAITGESNLFWDATNDRLGIQQVSPDAPIHVNGGVAMTAGWNRTATLQATYPVLVFNSNNIKWAGIGYDFGNDLKFWVNSGSSNVSSALNVLSISNSGVATFSNLAGSGTRMVVADSSGVLSTQTIPVGTVTSVTASSPLFSSGGTTPNITIQQASGSQNGFLSSTDWTTFNNKQNTISLTTTGTSGVATLIGTTLNIPNYGSALSGYLPLTGGTLTGHLNGTSAAFTGDIRSNGIYRDYQNEALIQTNTSGVTEIGTSGAANGRSLSFFAGNISRLTLASTGAATFSSSASSGQNLRLQTSIAAGRNYVQWANGSGDMGYIGYGGADGKFWINNQLNDDMLFYTNSSPRMTITSGGSITINNLAGSGNRIVVANSGGTLISAVIGSGLAFDGTTLTATGGSSGSITGSGTSGTVALFTGATSIGNSVITQSSSSVLISTTTNPYGVASLVVNHNSTLSRTYFQRGVELIEIFPSDGSGPNIISSSYTSSGSAYKPLGLSARQNSSDLYLTTGGRVLIGTTSDNGNLLRVNGTIFSDSSVTATSFFESSDATLKTLVQDDYQAKGIDSVVAKLYIKNGKQELGYFAQDLQGILPSAVSKGSDGLLNLSYREVHTAKIAYLEEEIRQIKKRYEIN